MSSGPGVGFIGMDSFESGRLSFTDRPIPPRFRLREIEIPAGAMRGYDEGEWREALVVVESGELDLECSQGLRRRFGPGTVMWLSGLPLLALRNSGREPVLLAAVSRQAIGETDG